VLDEESILGIRILPPPFSYLLEFAKLIFSSIPAEIFKPGVHITRASLINTVI
jgi:hypothetical protein